MLELSNQNVNKAIKVDPRRDREQLKMITEGVL